MQVLCAVSTPPPRTPTPPAQVQKQAATPYVVLSGTIKPGQSRDAGKRAHPHALPPSLSPRYLSLPPLCLALDLPHISLSLAAPGSQLLASAPAAWRLAFTSSNA